MSLSGPYLGSVVSNQDPSKLGRVKVSVPHVYGTVDGPVGAIGVNDIPWAIPAGLPAGGSSASGGLDWLPDPGDQILVFFLDGEPEKPVWMWLMQTVDQQKDFPLHHYSASDSTGKPDRVGLTRYDHTIEINQGSILASTKSGYQLLMLNGDAGSNNGRITLQTPLNQLLELDDETNTATLSVTQDCYFNIGTSWQAQADEIDFETMTGNIKITIGDSWLASVAGDFTQDVTKSGSFSYGTDLDVTVGGNLTEIISGAMSTQVAGAASMSFATLQLGAAATEPYVLGNRLLTLFNSLLVYLAGHTHGNGNEGSPTTPPLVPPQITVQPLLGNILSTTITGQA